MSRVIGIDYGERRIGIALSDPTGTIAQPHGVVLRRRGKRPPFRELLDIITANEVNAIVVGLPLTLEGVDSEWTSEVRQFAAGLAQRSGLSVTLADERMTSVRAERAVRSLGLPRHERERKERVDVAAAMLILQHYLDSRARPDPGTRPDG